METDAIRKCIEYVRHIETCGIGQRDPNKCEATKGRVELAALEAKIARLQKAAARSSTVMAECLGTGEVNGTDWHEMLEAKKELEEAVLAGEPSYLLAVDAEEYERLRSLAGVDSDGYVAVPKDKLREIQYRFDYGEDARVCAVCGTVKGTPCHLCRLRNSQRYTMPLLARIAAEGGHGMDGGCALTGEDVRRQRRSDDGQERQALRDNDVPMGRS